MRRNYYNLERSLKKQWKKKQKAEAKKEKIAKKLQKKTEATTKDTAPKNVTPKIKKEVTPMEKIEESLKNAVLAAEELQEASTKLTKINRLTDAKLGKLLSEVDLEITDILHAIEFSNMSASDGYKLSKELQEARKKRRKIKDMHAIVMHIKKQEGRIKTINELARSMNDFTNHSRQYTVRSREDLQDKIDTNTSSLSLKERYLL